MIHNLFGKPNNTSVFPIWLMRLTAKIGENLKFIGWTNPPLTSFCIYSMLIEANYPFSKTIIVLGELTFDLNDGVSITIGKLLSQK